MWRTKIFPTCCCSKGPLLVFSFHPGHRALERHYLSRLCGISDGTYRQRHDLRPRDATRAPGAHDLRQAAVTMSVEAVVIIHRSCIVPCVEPSYRADQL